MLRDVRRRALLTQVALVVGALLIVAFLIQTTAANLKARGIPLGFDFLGLPAGFNIAEALFSFDSSDTYFRAIAIGLSNTLFISGLVIVLSSILGLFVGVGRLSQNPLLAGLCRIWVEIARNTPAIVLLLFVYALWWQVLPPVRAALQLGPGMYLSQRGLVMPSISIGLPMKDVVLFVLAAFVALVWASRSARAVQERSGQRPPFVAWALIGIIGAAFIGGVIHGANPSVEWPRLARLNFVGGLELTPELTTIVVGLSFYTAGFIGEIVRGGILAISKGQWEAGRAIGLPERRILRLVIIPQMLRVILPPLTSQYVNVVKNSTLAIVVGYQDFMTIMGTTINQTSHAIEGVAIILCTYLVINLAISAAMNWFNSRVAIAER